MENFLLLPRAIVASLFDAGMAGAAGVLLARLWLIGSVVSEPTMRALRRTFLTCAVVMVITLPVQWWLLAAVMVGSSIPGVVRPELMDVLLATHAGRVLLPDFTLALLLLFASIPSWTRQLRSILPSIVLTSLLTSFRAASGHAAGDGDFTLGEVVQFVHLGSICVWAGGVMIAGLIVLPQLLQEGYEHEAMKFGKRLSFTSIGAVIFVTMSGLYNAWRGLGGSLHPLSHSQWGSLLVLKSILVAGALGLGTANWFSLRGEEHPSPQAIARFALRVRIEAIVMMAILLVSGWLAGSPPAIGV